jgi:tRNA-uridine 2-sulfurtransferase
MRLCDIKPVTPINQTKMERIWTKHKQLNTTLKPKVFVAMSGGVDSSVAAALLKKSGNFDIVGVFMKCWSALDQCSVERDAQDARKVAAKLDIPFHIFDFEKEYRKLVFNHMVREYAAGRTPNPDVFCNSEIKFGIFLEKALALGADFIATGHYAKLCRIEKQKNSDGFAIFQAKDQNKDQSYFLWRLNQKQLRRAIFPIGGYLKSEVRQMARQFGLPTAEKKDSQGLCFVGKIRFDDFLREILPKNYGPIVTVSGKKIGEHDGLNFYTIGQRRGIGIGGGKPLYVAEKEERTNALVVAEGGLDPALYKKEIEIGDINWISGQAPAIPFECDARIRYRQPLQKCRLIFKQRVLNALFKELQRAIAPGQSAVFYKKGELIGGGIIIL